MSLSVLTKRLMAVRFSENELVRVLEVTAATVNKIKSGLNNKPSYITGRRVEQLYCSFCAERHAYGVGNAE